MGVDCSLPNCPVCDGPHNSFICFKKEKMFSERNGKRAEIASKEVNTDEKSSQA